MHKKNLWASHVVIVRILIYFSCLGKGLYNQHLKVPAQCSMAAKRANLTTEIISKLLENKGEQSIELACEFTTCTPTECCMPLWLLCLWKLQQHETNHEGKQWSWSQLRKESHAKPFDNEATYSYSGLDTAALHTHHLVCNIYMCYAATSQENQWLECYSLCLSEVAALWSRINCRISWLCDSFLSLHIFYPSSNEAERDKIEMSL